MGLFKSHKTKPKKQPATSQSPTSTDKNSPRQSSSSSPSQPQQAQTTHHRNNSSSNLSNTSTLFERATTKVVPPPPLTRMTSYEEFLYNARLDAERSEEKQRVLDHAWRVAERRRRASNAWPVDPWRGGFGPPASGYGGQGVEGWLRGNGLKR